jgi:hypothetical protein
MLVDGRTSSYLASSVWWSGPSAQQDRAGDALVGVEVAQAEVHGHVAVEQRALGVALDIGAPGLLLDVADRAAGDRAGDLGALSRYWA